MAVKATVAKDAAIRVLPHCLGRTTDTAKAISEAVALGWRFAASFEAASNPKKTGDESE